MTTVLGNKGIRLPDSNENIVDGTDVEYGSMMLRYNSQATGGARLEVSTDGSTWRDGGATDISGKQDVTANLTALLNLFATPNRGKPIGVAQNSNVPAALTVFNGAGNVEAIKTIFRGNVDITRADRAQALPTSGSGITYNALNNADIDDSDFIVFQAHDTSHNTVNRFVLGSIWKGLATSSAGSNNGTDRQSVSLITDTTTQERGYRFGPITGGGIWVQSTNTATDGMPFTILHLKANLVAQIANGTITNAMLSTALQNTIAGKANSTDVAILNSDLTGNGGKYPKVNAAGDDIEFVDAGAGGGSGSPPTLKTLSTVIDNVVETAPSNTYRSSSTSITTVTALSNPLSDSGINVRNRAGDTPLDFYIVSGSTTAPSGDPVLTIPGGLDELNRLSSYNTGLDADDSRLTEGTHKITSPDGNLVIGWNRTNLYALIKETTSSTKYLVLVTREGHSKKELLSSYQNETLYTFGSGSTNPNAVTRRAGAGSPYTVRSMDLNQLLSFQFTAAGTSEYFIHIPDNIGEVGDRITIYRRLEHIGHTLYIRWDSTANVFGGYRHQHILKSDSTVTFERMRFRSKVDANNEEVTFWARVGADTFYTENDLNALRVANNTGNLILRSGVGLNRIYTYTNFITSPTSGKYFLCQLPQSTGREGEWVTLKNITNEKTHLWIHGATTRVDDEFIYAVDDFQPNDTVTVVSRGSSWEVIGKYQENIPVDRLENIVPYDDYVSNAIIDDTTGGSTGIAVPDSGYLGFWLTPAADTELTERPYRIIKPDELVETTATDYTGMFVWDINVSDDYDAAAFQGVYLAKNAAGQILARKRSSSDADRYLQMRHYRKVSELYDAADPTKAAPVRADKISILDSADSNNPKQSTVAQILGNVQGSDFGTTTADLTFDHLVVGSGITRTATAGEILAKGEVISNLSDQRLKTEIEPITDALRKLSELSAVVYEHNATALELGAGREGERQLGLYAQEVAEAFPEIVRDSAYDGYKTLVYERLVPVLVAALKEQLAVNADLINKDKDLEARLAALEAKFAGGTE